jgi:hypothetical protein
MKNKNFMIFQTAVRKYVGIYIMYKGYVKSNSKYFFGFYPKISIKNENILDEKFGKVSIMF